MKTELLMKKSLYLMISPLILGYSLPATAAKVGSTRAEALAAAQKRFGKIDANQDGKVTSDELTAFMKQRAAKSGDEFNEKRATRMFAKLDADSDGSVSRDEMSAATGTSFDKVDANHNGVIDAGEDSGKGGDES